MSVQAQTRPRPAWSITAIARLRDDTLCPRCGKGEVLAHRCNACGADFAQIGTELWEASERAVAALEERQAVLDRVPVARRESAPAPIAAPAASRVPIREVAPTASASVQSVLALAGAGLVAVAAVIFAFFNPELTASGVRAGILAAIAALFLGGGVLLVRRGLRFSAEAVGGLGMVFVILTGAASLPLLPAAIDPRVAAAICILIGGSGLAMLASRLRLRVWLWSSLTALAFVPVLLGSASDAPIGALAGTVTAVAGAAALVGCAVRLRARVRSDMRAETVTLTALQLVFSVIAVIQALLVEGDGLAAAFAVSAAASLIAVVATVSARHPAGALWSFVAGGAAVLAAVAACVGVFADRVPFMWIFAVGPTAAVAMLVAIGCVVPLHRLVKTPFLFGGAVTAVGVVAAVPTALSATALVGLLAGSEVVVVDRTEPALVVAAMALALGLCAFAWTTRESGTSHPEDAPAVDAASVSLPDAASMLHPASSASAAPAVSAPAARPLGTVWLGYLGQWYGVLALLLLSTLPGVPAAARIALGLALGVVLAIGAAATPVRGMGLARRVPIVVGAHLLVLVAAVLSWQHSEATVWAGIGVVIAVAVLSRTVPASARFAHVGAGFAYALVVFAIALGRAQVADVAILSLITSAAGAVAIVATFAPRVPARSWYAILAVTAVPFVGGVALVLVERSGWTALSTGVILLLTFALTVTRRAGLGAPLRVVAAGLIVPSASVVLVCLGAQFLMMSGSPVVLPAIAVVVAAVLPAMSAAGAALVPRIGAGDAAAARLAIEASTLLTAVIAVALSLTREAAGAPTAFIVLLVLGVGFAATARYAGRRYGWWLAGASGTGALWSLWSLVGVASVEAHLLPPALGAALVGVILTARGRAATGIYAAGLLAAVVPLVAVQAVQGSGAVEPWRTYGLIAAAWALVALAALLGRGEAAAGRRLRVLRPATLTAAIVAAAAGPVQGVRWGIGWDASPGTPLIVWALGLGVVAMGAATAAAGMLRVGAADGSVLQRTRWLAAPAVLFVTVGVWPTIEFTWSAIWIMWSLLVALLAVMVLAAHRVLRGGSFLPPVWFLFAIAFVTAVVAWSPRELRVEWFSLPLGVFLLAAGALGLRTTDGGIRSRSSWPAGRTDSWSLLAPGIIVAFSASVAATYTDPQTWRAILVMALALAAILIGASRRLAAPFVLGVVVLPIENVLAFMVQIGRGIESMPWWITLSVAGAVLLIIAVTYERRAGESSGITARLRDLR